MKLIKLLMIYAGCKEVGDVIKTIIYVGLMFGIILFSCLICGLMQLASK